MTHNTTTFVVCTNTTQEDFDRLVQRLKLSQSLASNPVLVPVISSSIMAHSLRDWHEEDRKKYLRLETAIVYWRKEYREKVSVRRLDMAQLSPHINSFAINIADTGAHCSGMEIVIDFLATQLLDLPHGPCANVSVELQEQVEFVRQRMLSLQTDDQ
jgi:hypothetical protein